METTLLLDSVFFAVLLLSAKGRSSARSDEALGVPDDEALVRGDALDAASCDTRSLTRQVHHVETTRGGFDQVIMGDLGVTSKVGDEL
jgi:hypothetical protein